MSKVKFIQISASNASEYLQKLNSAKDQYPGAIIFGTYQDGTKSKQEIWANGVQYEVGGFGDVEGLLDNVLVFGEDNTIIDSGIAKKDITEGYTKTSYEPVNAGEIDTLDTLRSRISKNSTTGAPENYTFDQFIKDLFQKINEEMTEDNLTYPTVTASVTGSQPYTLEVGDTTKKTLDVTVSKGTYTDGSFSTWAKTNGKEADTESTLSAGCTAGSYTICESGSTTAKSTNVAYTETLSAQFTYKTSGELSIPNAITESSKQYVVRQSYGASTNWENAKSSYGNSLFTSNPITAGTCTSSATAVRELSLSATFYHKIGSNNAALGKKTYSKSDNGISDIGYGTVLYIPDDWTWSLTWFSMKDAAVADDQYIIDTVYVSLPCNGIFNDATVFTDAPTDKPYKKYKKITFTDKMVSLTKADRITLNIGT